ncbi:MAG TPA: hypothetical protein VHA52_05365, partial [Candidatus Babeliaceae bacterium]|nr:hypothetical protein [Candidatus Babeliaceae bacterium]
VNLELKDTGQRTPLELVISKISQMKITMFSGEQIRDHFRNLIYQGAFINPEDKDTLSAIMNVFERNKLLQAIILGNYDEALKLSSTLKDPKDLVNCAHWIDALKFSVAQGHDEIVKYLLSLDDEFTVISPRGITRYIMHLEQVLIPRFERMLQDTNLSELDHGRYKKRLDCYKEIRLRLRATLMLPLESLQGCLI